MRLLILAALLASGAMQLNLRAAEPKADRRLVELNVAGVKYQGRPIVNDNEVCWLMERDGQLQCVDLKQVSDFKQVSAVFRPFNAMEMRARLQAEFGKSYEFAARGNHFLIAPGGKAHSCADVVEATSKSFTSYFSRRNLKLEKLETPMTTVIFEKRMQFLEYCKADGVKETKGLRGFYSPSRNRVALYLEQAPTTAATSLQPANEILAGMPRTPDASRTAHWLRFTPYGNPQADSGFQDTLIHETTHQLGFNSGLHSRLGDDPTWVVEGLAMLFEGDANRDDARQKSTIVQRMNRERFVWHQEYVNARRRPKSLEDFLTTNTLFELNTLDAYSEAWALMFFLAETRSSQLSGYLKNLATRTELGPYTPMQRLKDFQTSFGKDVPHLEVQYLRFMKELESQIPEPSVTQTDLFAQ